MNTKTQGNIGLGCAIAHFTAIGWTVSIPLNDSQKYDLVVDDGTRLQRVQVKTSRHRRPNGVFAVMLVQKGGSRKVSVQTFFDNTTADLLYVWCADGSQYLMPCSDVSTKTGISVGEKYKRYQLCGGREAKSI